MADNDVKELTTDDAPVKARGLEGVIALESELSSIDGQKGELIYRGYDINDLAEGASFEEVVHLLWNGSLPTEDELDTLRSELQSERALPAPVMNILRHAPDDAHSMAVLSTAVSPLPPSVAEADPTHPAATPR
jgi:citrate synthase